MTDEVAELVLERQQGAETLAAMIARRAACSTCTPATSTSLEAEGWLDRGLEFLPTTSRSPSGGRGQG